uniref:Uncharacterized protein n=1 Tax=Rhizophora mucronata TaxID=61149 RepID=A0A2P2J346_RHIMU
MTFPTLAFICLRWFLFSSLIRWPWQWKGYPMRKYSPALQLHSSQCWRSSPSRN